MYRTYDGRPLINLDSLGIWVIGLDEADWESFAVASRYSPDFELVWCEADADIIVEEADIDAAIETVRRLHIDYYLALPYREYLKTAHWHFTRRRALEDADHRCQLCNATGTLDVHHRTYERRGRERWNDVVALCRDCHGKFHNKLPKE